nr:hypothetical protein [Tanacetum cinerariifolium]
MMKGIKREFSVLRTPQQNGIAEKKNMTLVKAARTMLADSLLPIPFCAEAVNTACYVQNRVLVTKPHNKTSYELLLGRTPSTDFMRPFSCPMTILNTLDPLVKFDGKADKGFLVGYSISKKTKEENVQQYVLFPLWSFGSKDPHNTDSDATFEVKEPEFEVEKPESEVHVSPSSSAKTKKHDDKTKREAKGKIPAIGQMSTNSTNTFSAAGPSNIVVSSTLRESLYVDPSQYPNDQNMPALEDITYSDDEEDVGAEADFSNLETTITDEGIDYEEFFAPVARIEAIRLFLAYASFMGFMVYQMDVKSAFMYGTIEEEVYVCQPPGFKDPDYPDKREKIDQTLFIKKQKGDILLVQVYVDDIIFGSTNKDLCKAFEKLMKDKLKMSSMGELTFFLDGKSASIPIDTEKPLLKDPDGDDVDVHTYRSMIGSLMYLTSSRPDIMFAGKPHLGLWYPKDSPFNLVAYSDNDYAGASLYRKSTTGGCQFLKCRLISWQCKKKTVVSTLSTEAEYVAAASCYAQVLWIQNQLLDYGKKVIIIEPTVREALRLNDAKSIYCLPNEEIFTELSRMGYRKPSTKLTFYKEFFSAQWKFLIHNILQCMSAKRTSWNEFSSSMASAIICLSTGRKFNFLKYIFDSLVRNVDSSSKFYMYPRFLQLMIRAQVGGLSSHTTKYSSPALTQKQAVDDVVADDDDADDVSAADAEPTPPSPPPTTPPPPPQELPSISIESSADTIMDDQEDASKQGDIIANIDADEDVTLKDVADDKVEENTDVQGRPEESQAQIYKIDLEHADKVLSMQDDESEPAELKEVVEVATTAKLMTEVVTVVAATITAATTPITAATITAASTLKRKLQTEAQARKNMMIYLRNMAGFKMDCYKGMSYDAIRPIFEKYFNSNMAFLEKTKEQLEEEESRALKRTSESLEEKATKKQKLDEEVEELKKHLQIVPNDDDDDVYTEATPLALKNPVVDYLEVLWQLVKEIFTSSKHKNYSDDFLLTTLIYMFEKPDVQAQIWTNQRSVHGLAKVKSWRLLESCGVRIITFTTTQMILLVERRYPLTRFTLDQMLNNVRLEAEKESKVSLELLRFTSKIYSKGLLLLVEDLLLLRNSPKELEGTTYTFQFYFDTGSTAKRPEFVSDTVFKPPIPFLPPSISVRSITPESETTPAGQINRVTSRKRNIQTKDADDAFDAYSVLCQLSLLKVIFPPVLALDHNHVGPSVSSHRKRTVRSTQVIPTTYEVGLAAETKVREEPILIGLQVVRLLPQATNTMPLWIILVCSRFNETTPAGQIDRVTSRKRNIQTKDADDAFVAYSVLCQLSLLKVIFPPVLALDYNHAGPSVLSHRKRTVRSTQVIPTTYEDLVDSYEKQVEVTHEPGNDKPNRKVGCGLKENDSIW